MPVTATVEGTFHVNGRPVDDATAYLVPATAFSSPPAMGDAIPTAAAVATCTTGPANGGRGAYRFIGVAGQEYYVALAYAGLTCYDYFNASALGIGPSGQVLINTAAAYGGNILEAQVNGQPRFSVSATASGATVWASGTVGLNGPWSYASPTTDAPPPALKLTQQRLSAPTARVSGAACWLNFDDRWGIGVLDSTNPSDGPGSPSFTGATWPGGGSCMFWADLRQNETRMLLDGDGELRLETKNSLRQSNWYNLTLQHVSSAGAVSGILQNGTYGFGVGWRTVLPMGDGIATQFQSEIYDTVAQTTVFTIYNKINGTDTLHMRLHETGGLWIPGGAFGTVAAGGALGVIKAGNDFNWSGSAGGTLYAGAAKSGFAGNLLDFQVAGSTRMTVGANGQAVHTLTDSSTTGQGYALRLQHQLDSASGAVGIGAGIQFYVPNGANTLAERGTIQHLMTTVTPNAEASEWMLTTTNGGATSTALTIASNGDLLPAGVLYVASTASTQHGNVSAGAGGFSGSANHFSGSSFGTQLAVNGSPSYRGDLINAQVSGTTKFKVDYQGTTTIAGDLAHTGAKTGFNGTSPIAKPTVSGTKSGGSALASLITQLAALGLIADSTT
jgi:hypothetical protein